MLGCDGWNIVPTDPPMRWSDHPAHKPKPIETFFPLLFISNTLDPVTPLKAGVKMARKFLHAGFIEQKSEGHCSITCGSLCTIKNIRAYLREGKVPPIPEWGPDGREIEEGKWQRCERDDWPWMERVWAAEGVLIENVERLAEFRMLEAWKHVGEMAYKQRVFWGMRR